jgi:hypothetical protein
VNNFTDNHGATGTEGFMGVGMASGGGWTYLVWNAADTSQWPVNTVGGFSDVPATAFYADAVVWAASEGITTGTSATTFSPDLALDRGQMATLLWRYDGEPAPPASHPFSDVPSGTYYEAAVAWLAQSGITSGTSATTFSPNAQVTRGQMVTFLHRYEQIFG